MFVHPFPTSQAHRNPVIPFGGRRGFQPGYISQNKMEGEGAFAALQQFQCPVTGHRVDPAGRRDPPMDQGGPVEPEKKTVSAF